MNRRVMIVLLFGLIFAGSASFILYRLMMNRISKTSPIAESKPIVVAARALEAGRLIREPDLTVMNWSGPVPHDAILNKHEAVGRSVIEPFYEKEPVVQSRLSAVGSGGGLAAFIPSGMRAVAVRVNDVVGVAGFVMPGSHVDVIATAQQTGSAGASDGPVTRTVLQNIMVLSAGQDYKPNADGKPVAAQVVNLLVTPGQAEILSLVGNQATVQLMLRNDSDKDLVESHGIELHHLLGVVPTVQDVQPQRAATVRTPTPTPAPPPAAPVAATLPPPAAPDTGEAVEIIQGTKRSEVRILPIEVQ